MKRRVGSALGPLFAAGFLFILQGCLFSQSEAVWEPEPWPQGTFELEGGTGSTWVSGRLFIGPDLTMTFSSSTGTCADRDPRQVEEDRVENQRTFRCSGATFTVRPMGNTVRGQARIPVTRTVRGERFCATRDEEGRCLHYEYRDRTVRSVETVQLQVVRRGSEDRHTGPCPEQLQLGPVDVPITHPGRPESG